jgi:hypothetical protein
MKMFKTFGIAAGLVAAALVGGTLISAASASPAGAPGAKTSTSLTDVDAAAYCDLWQQTFADELGVDVSALTPAAKAATSAAIDAAVASGDLPADIGERMQTALENATGDGCRLLGAGFHAWGRHAIGADWIHDWATAAAATLGMTVDELASDLRSGDTLMEIAEAQGVAYEDVSAAIIDAAKADLDALVAADRITQERADAMLEQLTAKLDAGEFPPLFGDGDRARDRIRLHLQDRLQQQDGDQVRLRIGPFGGGASNS